MHAVILQHHPIEGPGSLAPWLDRHAKTNQIVRLYDGEECPAPDAVDLLIILGGPMSVNDEGEFPWLVAEKVFIRQVIDRQRPVLGICLGSQLIASALGAGVRTNRHKEIGWLPIEGLTTNTAITLPSTTVFQWHGDTFDLPAGATLLARSAACAHQAFLYKNKVLALQFHLEATPELVQCFIETGSDELVDAPYVQSPQAILATPADFYHAGNQLLEELLSRIIQ
ncbi:MAG: amidotransferase [Deltaproteobacteria bacterium HGW-Deltaproteobacteria-4]|nr:MAG: amidotransferase [Deltaproteobacteria bacterium HGW-Deltaproteobacteria-4]